MRAYIEFIALLTTYAFGASVYMVFILLFSLLYFNDLVLFGVHCYASIL